MRHIRAAAIFLTLLVFVVAVAAQQKETADSAKASR